MNCNCHRLGAGPLATTITAFPCGDVWALAQQNPSLVNVTRYHLCTATHKAGQLALDAGHWVWEKLRELWDGFRQALANLGAFGARVMRGASNALQSILHELKNLIQWLDDQAKHVLDWFLWVGAAAAGVWLLHAYLERPQQPPAAPAKAAA